jgi:membrane protein DedA with SNARE-associated domain
MDFAHYTNLVRDFVAQYPNWSAAVVFALAFGESLAFVSLVLPFWAMLVAIGAIVSGTNTFNFWIIVAAAASGAALGDWLSYWLGYHYHERIQSMWPLKNHPKLIEKGRVFFRKWGAWALVLGRFSGPLRASVPIAAGIAQMPQAMFQFANWTSAFLWAFALLSPGALGMKWWFDYFS